MSNEAVLLDVLTHARRAIRAAKQKDAFLRDEIAQSAVAFASVSWVRQSNGSRLNFNGAILK
jgi:hypothetical protein